MSTSTAANVVATFPVRRRKVLPFRGGTWDGPIITDRADRRPRPFVDPPSTGIGRKD
ncbi:hypothetical protein GCM10010185_57840 [Saccharothrix coeruleofusca]|uniref:Uncharacterized protein n=1 Tax=Saccharothrix coeruleofusca TaxID=33919 RepID=A0A918EGW9_9PSEU|nr:hypothetical protein GCM10010185_57840 [Saccharothrix coeruleofusca]